MIMIRYAWIVPLAGALVLSTVMGCGRESRIPTSAVVDGDGGIPARSSAATQLEAGARGDFYPLQVGNRWRYESTSSKLFVPRQGEPFTKRGRSTREVTIVASEMFDGREYFREDSYQDTAQRSPVIHAVRWLRQDRSGLFERGALPPPSSGIDPAAPERTLLQYPLHKAARWGVSSVPLVTANVERRETIETPAGRFPAWRIQIRNTTHKGELAHAWFGPAGYLGMRTHAMVGGPGSELVITTDMTEWLTAIDLAPRKPLAPVEEAREALGAVLTGELVYYQKFGTFTDAADTEEIRVKLETHLDVLSQRWSFSVREVSTTGFVAEARGRAGTRTRHLIVTLRYVRGQPPAWDVEKRPRR